MRRRSFRGVRSRRPQSEAAWLCRNPTVVTAAMTIAVTAMTGATTTVAAMTTATRRTRTSAGSTTAGTATATATAPVRSSVRTARGIRYTDAHGADRRAGTTRP